MSDTYFVREKKERNYTVMDNTFIKDTSLSAKAKGVMSFLLSLPDDWKLKTSELHRYFADGATAIRTAVKELLEHGYLYREQLLDEHGRFAGVLYRIIEVPQEEPKAENRISENQTLQSTNIQSTNNNIYVEDSQKGTPDDALSASELAEAAYKIYPRHDGKAKGVMSFEQYLLGTKTVAGKRYRFNHQQLFIAIQVFAEQCEKEGREKQYIPHFSAFMNNGILDFIEKSEHIYEGVMKDKYGGTEVKFKYGR